MQFQVYNRFSGEPQFTADIDCDENALVSIKRGLAVHWAMKHGADLRGAYFGGADLRGADFHGADLRGADLRDADLGGANLHGANLRGADLGGADLGGANLHGATNLPAFVQGPLRSDWYAFQLIERNSEWRVIAGCRDFSVPEARAHWHPDSYRNADLAAETNLIIDSMLALAALRGIGPAQPTTAEAA